MYKLFTAIAVISLTLMFTGCGSADTMKGRDATEMVNSSVRKRASFSTLMSGGEMKIVDKGSDFSLGVQINPFVAVSPDKLRIKATKLAGGVDAFDMLMIGDDIAFFVPRQNTLYVGNVSKLRDSSININPKMIIARLLKADKGLLDRRWKVIGSPKGGVFGGNSIELEQYHRKGNDYVRIRVDSKRRLLQQIRHYNGNRQLLFTEEYGGYREIPSGETTLSGKSIGSGTFFPTRLTLRWPARSQKKGERYVKVTLRDYKFDRDPEELEEAFEGIDGLDGSEKRKSLNRVEVESDRPSYAPQT